jgi:hypothetical protein
MRSGESLRRRLEQELKQVGKGLALIESVGRLLTLVIGDGEGAEEVEEGAELVKVGCPLTSIPPSE